MKASQETREFASSILREMLPILDEKQRRMLSGVVASNLGYGGISFVNSITGQSRNTISSDAGDTDLTKDHPEGKSPDAKGICLTNSGRLRRPGGGRKPIENKYPDLQEKIEEIIKRITNFGINLKKLREKDLKFDDGKDNNTNNISTIKDENQINERFKRNTSYNSYNNNLYIKRDISNNSFKSYHSDNNYYSYSNRDYKYYNRRDRKSTRLNSSHT